MSALLQTAVDIYTTPFLLRALAAVLIIAPLLAIAGCMVVHANMAFFSEAVGHSALTGVALGTLLGVASASQSIVLLVFAILFAILVALLKHASKLSADSIVSISMSFCVALGVAVLSQGGGFSTHAHILVGDVLTVSAAQLKQSAVISLLAVVALGLVWNGLLLSAVNASLARSRGVRIVAHDILFSVLLAILVMQSVPWVGILVVNSMLILPAATARNLARSMRGYVWLSILISIVSAMLGVYFSVYFDTATGATVVLVALCFFLASLVARVR